MQPLRDGWFEAVQPARAGTRYAFRIDDGPLVPDPASRSNPDDVHAPSAVVDPCSYEWQDGHWHGRPWAHAVIYELHVGTFTREGRFTAAIERLDHVVDLGATAIELMPVADFPGGRNWGYDGVLLYAPDASYGAPDDLKRLIDAAHAHGLMVLLDVVYNHFGPEGNYLHAYAPAFFNPAHSTPWGAAINFDAADDPTAARTVRDFYIHNALYWLTEFHLDGLRFDAVHAIVDTSVPEIMAELTATVRAACPSREVHLVLENDRNASHLLERDGDLEPRYATAQWNDDAHHALHVLATGETDGYYADYVDAPLAHLGRALAEGFVHQHDWSAFRNACRGEPSAQLPPLAFVNFLQNHDQIGNRAFGERMTSIADAALTRVAVACLLLSPSPPLLFMGEEFAASTPFLFFCDFGPDLAAAVTEGRRKEFARFARFADPAVRERIPDPNARATFEASRLEWQEVESSPHQQWLEFYRACLDVRRHELVPRLARIAGHAGMYSVTGDALHVTWRLPTGERWHLLANFGEADAPVTAVAGRTVFAFEGGDIQAAAALRARSVRVVLEPAGDESLRAGAATSDAAPAVKKT